MLDVGKGTMVWVIGFDTKFLSAFEKIALILLTATQNVSANSSPLRPLLLLHRYSEKFILAKF